MLWRVGIVFVILALLQFASGLDDDQSESHDARDCRMIWSSRWTVCSKKCDGGTQSRKMRVIRHAKPGGKACPLVMPTQSRPCNEVACAKSSAAPTLAPLFKPRSSTTKMQQKQPISVVLCRTTKGHFRMISRRSPEYNIGIDRFLELVDSDFFKESAFFRFMPRVFAQFGIATDPAVTQKWASTGPIADEGHSTPAQREHLRRGDVSFTGHGKNSRLTELFIVTGESEHLGMQNWESPVAHVPLDDMTSVIDKLYSEYGNFAPFGKGPDHERLLEEGDAYLLKEFPLLDRIHGCKRQTGTLSQLWLSSMSTDRLMQEYGHELKHQRVYLLGDDIHDRTELSRMQTIAVVLVIAVLAVFAILSAILQIRGLRRTPFEQIRLWIKPRKLDRD